MGDDQNSTMTEPPEFGPNGAVLNAPGMTDEMREKILSPNNKTYLGDDEQDRQNSFEILGAYVGGASLAGLIESHIVSLIIAFALGAGAVYLAQKREKTVLSLVWYLTPWVAFSYFIFSGNHENVWMLFPFLLLWAFTDWAGKKVLEKLRNPNP